MQHLWNFCGGGIFHSDKGDCKKDNLHKKQQPTIVLSLQYIFRISFVLI